jgi:hypothetical protein
LGQVAAGALVGCLCSAKNEQLPKETAAIKRVSSIFSELLQLFPRLEFEAAVREHRAERHGRGFRCWTQFVAMLFC